MEYPKQRAEPRLGSLYHLDPVSCCPSCVAWVRRCSAPFHDLEPPNFFLHFALACRSPVGARLAYPRHDHPAGIRFPQLMQACPPEISANIVSRPEYPEPFFDAGSLAGSSRRKLLLLSYHFAPSRAVGALRWQGLARYAVRHGYGIDVVTLAPSSIPECDPDRLRELPRGVRLFGVRPPQIRVHDFMSRVFAARRWVVNRLRQRSGTPLETPDSRSATPRRESFAWSELHAIPLTARELDRLYSSWLDYAVTGAWATEVARTAITLAGRDQYAAIITCGPPHMVHEAGRLVARETNLPLVLDFRDPWSLVQRVPEALASPIWLRYAKRFERSAISAASLVVVNTEAHRAALRRAYPEQKSSMITVTNGYDEDITPTDRTRRRFIIAYAGTVYLDRDPRPLFRASARLIRERSLSRDDFAIAFMGGGTLDGMSISDLAETEGVGGYVDVRPSGPRREALQFLGEAKVLVSLPQDSDMAIPSKIFEYMQYNAWLLALATPTSATALLLQDTPADVIRPGDEDALFKVLAHHYEQHLRGESPPRIADDRRFSREHQAGLLFNAIEQIITPTQGVPQSIPKARVVAPLA